MNSFLYCGGDIVSALWFLMLKVTTINTRKKFEAKEDYPLLTLKVQTERHHSNKGQVYFYVSPKQIS